MIKKGRRGKGERFDESEMEGRLLKRKMKSILNISKIDLLLDYF